MGIETGGGVDRADWRTMPIEMIWPLLKNHDSAPHRTMGDAWSKSSELLANHVRQVKAYRDKLAEAWPPERSRAAAAYVDRLEVLIASLEETQLASSANGRALIGGVDAVDEAKVKLAALEQEYTANKATIEAYEKAAAATPLATTDPLPTAPTGAYERRTELERQARDTMQSLSAELAATQSTFIAPKRYIPSGRVDGGEDGLGSGASGVGMPPMVPPFTPRSVTPPSTSKRAVDSSVEERPTTSPVTRPGLPDSSLPSNPSLPSYPSTEGPILGGTKPQQPSTTGLPPVTTPTITPTTTPTMNTPGPYTFTPSSPSTPSATPVSTSPFSRSPAVNGAPPAVNGAPPGTFQPTSGARGTSVSNGGVIGGLPSGTSGGAQPGGRGLPPGSPARGAQRINPSGGMIGGANPAAPMGRRASARGDEESRGRQWDPDNPWETSEGIDPVLLPPTAAQRIDPGPTIGGR
ncbi:hypothetical protein [Actinoplanes utahensis]|uniref:PPE family domain-containing protein n=1 Tax=Actinoplanes utahensis TaxID=1869 RepID=A0A0A6WY71_ACTUT|nr:hypothetical protein [Actinoplanes utahensis]KHD72692.1 hypothetical protein MB27_40465 [Actinoplanes utahensis]GIF29149.1 hypothetical protein Aut01nite_21350 [Actinoplanes utahensis]